MLFISLTSVQDVKQLFTMLIDQPCLKVKLNNLFKKIKEILL